MANLSSTASPTLLTADDLARLDDPNGLPHELVRGVLHLVTPSLLDHGSVVMRVSAALSQHVYPHEMGELFGESTGFLLERDPDTVLCPDVAFIASRRLPPEGLGGRTFLALAPDLAVEVLSKSNRPGKVRGKVADYLRLGVRCVWVVDPRRRAVRIHTADGAERLVGEDGILDGGELLPGFRCPVAWLFAALRR
jgi:Uma2 family endonuclease